MKKGSKVSKGDFSAMPEEDGEAIERLMKLCDLQSRAIESLSLAVASLAEAAGAEQDGDDDDDDDDDEGEEEDEEKEDK